MNAKITLLAAKQNTVLRGHPWIFPKAIAKTDGKLVTGHLVSIHNADGELIGVGVFNEHSLYRVRVLALATDSIDTNNLNLLIADRLKQAKLVRECLNLPNADTTAYRFEFIETDSRDYLAKAGEYDVIVLDPPKLVPSRQPIQRAKNYYRFLHRELFKHMKSGVY